MSLFSSFLETKSLPVPPVLGERPGHLRLKDQPRGECLTVGQFYLNNDICIYMLCNDIIFLSKGLVLYEK